MLRDKHSYEVDKCRPLLLWFDNLGRNTFSEMYYDDSMCLPASRVHGIRANHINMFGPCTLTPLGFELGFRTYYDTCHCHVDPICQTDIPQVSTEQILNPSTTREFADTHPRKSMGRK